MKVVLRSGTEQLFELNAELKKWAQGYICMVPAAGTLRQEDHWTKASMDSTMKSCVKTQKNNQEREKKSLSLFSSSSPPPYVFLFINIIPKELLWLFNLEYLGKTFPKHEQEVSIQIQLTIIVPYNKSPSCKQELEFKKIPTIPRFTDFSRDMDRIINGIFFLHCMMKYDNIGEIYQIRKHFSNDNYVLIITYYSNRC